MALARFSTNGWDCVELLNHSNFTWGFDYLIWGRKKGRGPSWPWASLGVEVEMTSRPQCPLDRVQAQARTINYIPLSFGFIRLPIKCLTSDFGDTAVLRGF